MVSVAWYVKEQLDCHLADIGRQLECDVISITGGIVGGIDVWVKNAIESHQGERKATIAVILQTGGGDIVTVERMVDVIRNFYQEMIVVVPNMAMSAGTVFALSADRIMMTYFSRLGPIDPQIVKEDGKPVPVLSYLEMFDKFVEKARKGELTTLEYTMINQQIDIGELHKLQQACELSVELLCRWLPKYKFKDWKVTGSRGAEVTEGMKQVRAKEIADALNDPGRWRTHSRGISMSTLWDELKIKNRRLFRTGCG